MLLNVTEELQLAASPESAWKLLRDTPRLTSLLPGVESVQSLNEPGMEAYAAKASDSIGPFKITMNLEVRVTETCEQSLLKAEIKGTDSLRLNRVTGWMQISLTAVASATPVATPVATKMRFDASIEVLGKLATLGAVPIRRRTTQLFGEFARNIQEQFANEHS